MVRNLSAASDDTEESSTEESGEEAKEDPVKGADYREKSGHQHKVIDKIFRTEGDQLFNASVNKNIEKEMKEDEEKNREASHKIFSSDKGRFQHKGNLSINPEIEHLLVHSFDPSI